MRRGIFGSGLRSDQERGPIKPCGKVLCESIFLLIRLGCGDVRTVSLNRLFEVMHGTKLDLKKMVQCSATEKGSVAFIGRSGENNGLSAFVEPLDDVLPYERGLITVALGGSALSSFVQPNSFYTAQNVDVLRPLDPMSIDERLYYCLCIEANCFRYSTYGREANRTLKTIPVPARSEIPSWVRGVSKGAVDEFCEELVNLAAMRSE